jgi:hypothetical protein
MGEEFERLMEACVRKTGQPRDKLYKEWYEWDRRHFGGLLPDQESFKYWATYVKKCVPKPPEIPSPEEVEE